MTFEGLGHSKREARASAARACLAALLARAGRVLPAPIPHQDFTSDEPAKFPVSEFQCLETKMRSSPTITVTAKEASPSKNKNIVHINMASLIIITISPFTFSL
ncbi:unnamed protein product [Diatraea saccharalis]|uniref:DRBM domain-containing protein n=1 Tax=Diatraea saccharalis TaxID=40085 RepID=A0A9N9WD43_9NEOP|nr:unnamed protein product [Diatraea saccharalis]